MSSAGDGTQSPEPLYLLLSGDHLLCDARGLLWPLNSELAAPWLSTDGEKDGPDWLGEWQDTALYALMLPAPVEHLGGEWLPLRSQLGQVDEWLFTLAGRALQLHRWRQEHRYCGRCGGVTEPLGQESARLCQRCDLRFYPRLSPCMITLITRDDHCLLARHARSRQPIHTALAGFVEVGERVEDTVHREIQEEVGLEVAPPKYYGSQPWPFPGQLMLGFHAEYRSGDVRVDGREILSAEWWRYDRLPDVPPAQTLAGRLIAHFVASQQNKAPGDR